MTVTQRPMTAKQAERQTRGNHAKRQKKKRAQLRTRGERRGSADLGAGQGEGVDYSIRAMETGVALDWLE